MKDNTKFYTCFQNNSGGYLIQNDDVDLFVCVEAKNLLEAKRKFKRILKNYREFCSCCGVRWSDDFLSDDSGYDVPSIYGEPYHLYKNSYFCSLGCIIIYYLNGTKVRHNLIKNLFNNFFEVDNEKNI